MAIKLFFDTEFTDLKQDCEIISIGIIAVDDKYPNKVASCFYAESMDYSDDKCSDFVVTNVLPKLTLGDKPQCIVTDTDKSTALLGTEEDIRMNFYKWVYSLLPEDYDEFIDGGSTQDKIDVWSDCLAYDWVLFNHLFSTDGILPSFINYIPFDLSTYFKICGIDPDVDRIEFACEFGHKEDVEEIGIDNFAKHNSLFDAMVIYYNYDILTTKKWRDINGD